MKKIITLFLLYSLSAFAQTDIDAAKKAFDAGDYETAYKLYLPLAEKGDAEAQTRIGGFYLQGKGVAQDYAVAAKWLRKAADQGNAEGQNALGILYGLGKGVAQNYAEALKWLRKAADQGNAEGQNNLGGFYATGQGVAQDYAEAVSGFARPRTREMPTARITLGHFMQEAWV